MQSWGLNDASFGGLSSYNVTVMVLSHLLRHGHVLAPGGQEAAEEGEAGPSQPPPPPCNNLANLLLSFCRYFGSDFNCDAQIICLSSPVSHRAVAL